MTEIEMDNEQQLILKINTSYQEVVKELPQAVHLTINTQFSKYNPEQRYYLQSLLKNHADLFLLFQFKDQQQRIVSLTEDKLEQFNLGSHLDWSLHSISFDSSHASIHISLCFQDELKGLLIEHLPITRKKLNLLKCLVILLVSLSSIGSSIYLVKKAPFWIFFTLFALGFLCLKLSLDLFITLFKNRKPEENTIQTFSLAHYFAAHLEDYALQTLALNQELK